MLVTLPCGLQFVLSKTIRIGDTKYHIQSSSLEEGCSLVCVQKLLSISQPSKCCGGLTYLRVVLQLGMGNYAHVI